MTKTCIAEGVVGCISAAMFLWMFPISVEIEGVVLFTYAASDLRNLSLIISSATLLFVVALFGLLSVYCLSCCLEKAIINVIENKEQLKKIFAESVK